MKIIDPGHSYEVTNVGNKSTQPIQFIKKEPKDGKLVTVQEGTTTEAVLNVVAHRLGTLQDRLPDQYTKAARWHVGQALHALGERTKDREERKVEGTPQA